MTLTEPGLATGSTVADAFLASMGGPRVADEAIVIEHADAGGAASHRRLRAQAFVDEQHLFETHDLDAVDGEPTTIVLVARRASDGEVVGGVRVHPHEDHGAIGWWRGSRLVVMPDAGSDRERRASLRVGSTLVRAAMAVADDRGALRFDATVQQDKRRFFERLGWRSIDTVVVAGAAHDLMHAPSVRFQRQLDEYKAPIGRLVGALAPGGRAPGGLGFVGDDAAPVPGSDLVAACDAIVPAMVERDPEWAGWASVLVNVNDLAAMGAEPLGILDAVAGRTEEDVAAVLRGMRAAAEAYGVPVLGGHTQLGDRASLTVTALGRAPDPVPGGGGRAGDDVRLVADLGGAWRPGYAGRQWDSTTHRSPVELRHLVGTLRRHRPAAAKDVSMGGLIGTLAMLAEASGTGAEVELAAVPRPAGAAMGDWLSCFPGFALLTADRPGSPLPPAADLAPATVAPIGHLTDAVGEVRLRWPDGRTTIVVTGGATGLGCAAAASGLPTEGAVGSVVEGER